ncbi:hypothetical protein GCM10010286_03340 [Streptomyces toxytricini]|nr:hypothetical protein GCM10010286_03340 [Streptomyces toxytricini]
MQPERVRKGFGDGHRPVAGLALDVTAGLQHQRQHGPGGEQHHDRHLEDEYLCGDAPRALPAQ